MAGCIIASLTVVVWFPGMIESHSLITATTRLKDCIFKGMEVKSHNPVHPEAIRCTHLTIANAVIG